MCSSITRFIGLFYLTHQSDPQRAPAFTGRGFFYPSHLFRTFSPFPLAVSRKFTIFAVFKLYSSRWRSPPETTSGHFFMPKVYQYWFRPVWVVNAPHSLLQGLNNGERNLFFIPTVLIHNCSYYAETNNNPSGAGYSIGQSPCMDVRTQ